MRAMEDAPLMGNSPPQKTHHVLLWVVMLFGFVAIIGMVVALLVLGSTIGFNTSTKNLMGFDCENAILNIGVLKNNLNAYYGPTGKWSSDIDAVTAKWIDYFAETVQPGDNSKKAVVFDIDETALSNLPLILESDYGFIPQFWLEWEEQLNASALVGTQQLYNKLVELNVTIIFLTGRRDDLTNATRANLLRVGYTSFAELILRNPSEYSLSAAAYKSARRKGLSEKYEIIGCAGDQISDCSGGYAGYIMKLPNYAYFIA